MYRLQKHILYTPLRDNSRQMAVFFIYLDKKIPDFASLQPKFSVILEKLAREAGRKEQP